VTILPYVDSLRRFLERKAAEEEQRRAALAVRLEKATERLIRRFSAINRVVVIGSFLSPQFFRLHSDVDIVVRGLSRGDYFAALALLEQELHVPVDLLRQEELPNTFRVRLKNALVLYAE
jgi:predicted nucleotidyltransferase